MKKEKALRLLLLYRSMPIPKRPPAAKLECLRVERKDPDIKILSQNLASLLGTLTCKNGTCKGTAYPIQCLPSQCADTPIVSELGSVEMNGQSFGPVLILDDGGLPFATPGTALAGGREP